MTATRSVKQTSLTQEHWSIEHAIRYNYILKSFSLSLSFGGFVPKYVGRLHSRAPDVTNVPNRHYDNAAFKIHSFGQ